MTAKIGILVPTLSNGGAERVALLLARQIAARRHEVTLITFADEPVTWEPTTAADPFRYIHLDVPYRPRLARFVRLVAAVRQVIIRERFDAVLGILPYANLLLSAAKRRSVGARLIGSEHSLPARRFDRLFRTVLSATSCRILYGRLDALVCVSAAVSEQLEAAYGLPRRLPIHVIDNPVDVARVRRLSVLADTSDAAPVGGPRYVIRCFARLVREKGLDTLCDAIALLPDSYRLEVYGVGSAAPFRNRCESLGIGSRVNFYPPVENPFVLMRTSSAVVLPSHAEGFGLVAVEAAAVGVPFVGTAVGGLARLCERLGHPTVPVGDAQALARALMDASHSAPVVDEDRLLEFAPASIAKKYLQVLLGSEEMEFA